MRMVAWFHWLPSNKRKSKERKVSSVSDHTCLDIRTNATPILRSYLLLTLTIKLTIENNLVHNRHGLQSHSKISQRIKGMRPQLYPRHCHLWPSSPFSWSCPRHEDQFEQCRGFFEEMEKTTKSQLYPPPPPHCVPNSKQSVYSSLWIIVRSWIAIALT